MNDDTLSIIEDMLLLMKLCPQLDHERLDHCNVNDLMERVFAIRKQQEQDCLQEAERIGEIGELVRQQDAAGIRKLRDEGVN